MADWGGTVRRARTGLLDFTRFTFDGHYVVNWHHELLARELDAVIEGRERRLIVLLPSQVGKSELSTRRAAAYAVGRNPNEQIIAGTYSADWAGAFGADVQRIMGTEEYQTLFPGSRLRTRGSQDDGNAARQRGYFEIVGHSGSVKCVECWRWFAGEILKRIGESGRVVIVNTRRHRDDLVGRVLRLQPEKWRVVEIPSLRKAEATHPDDPREEGEALWPRHKSQATLEEERRLDKAIFAALDQQDPSEAGGTDWPPHLFRDVFVPPERFPVKFDARIVAVDPAKGKSSKTGDFTAMVFVGFADRLVWVDAVLERIPLEQLTGRLITFCSEWKPDALGIEAEQFQEFLLHDLERETQGRFGLQWSPVPMLSGGIKKEVRIRRLNSLIVDRKLRFLDRPEAGCRLLVEQLMDFPTGEHDDGPDALEMAVRLAGEVLVEV
jgi:predicted phage terminase large subunit-like protein